MSDSITPPPVPPTPSALPTPPPIAKAPGRRIALAALVLGIVAFVCAVIPGVSFVAFVPAFAALAFGIVALVSRAPGRGKALTGVILGPIALLVAIIVSVTAIATGFGTNADLAKPAPAATETAAPKPTTKSTPEPEPTVEAEPVVTVPADVVYTGVGDSVIPITLPDGAGQLAVATLSHDGSSNFSIFTLDANMGQQDLIVNTIGGYQGTVLFNTGSADAGSLEISADGNWSVTLRSLLTVRQFDGVAISGLGDDVVLYYGNAGVATIAHDGSRNFTVWTYGDGTELAVNEIGAYTGSVRWTKGPSVVEVNADGNWSISVG